jgi:hypothetical protein
VEKVWQWKLCGKNATEDFAGDIYICNFSHLNSIGNEVIGLRDERCMAYQIREK